MKTLNIEMPVVQACTIGQCAYNMNNACHAKAITIGDLHEPECDTFFQAQPHNRATQRTAGVGACKVVGCRFNQDYECGAESIRVGHHNQKVHCLTFALKP